MSFEFHIIYTPGTAIYLTPLVHSLLAWSDCTFRLVANGCLADEQAFLRHFCDSSTRLEFSALPTKKVVRHGQALAFLHEQTTSDHFCFMDSDILATGEFVEAFQHRLQHNRGLFSCNPIWCRSAEQILPDDAPVIHGRYNNTSAGLCLGSTYFAIYDNQLLTDFLRTTAVGFDGYQWSRIPPRDQETLSALGQRREGYDTGKVLHLLLLAQGEDLLFWNSPDLLHLGGFSRYQQHQTPNAPRTFYSSQYSVTGNLSRLWARLLYSENMRNLLHAFPSRYLPLRLRQIAVERYFSNLIVALCEKTPMPDIPRLSDHELTKDLQRASTALLALYQSKAGRSF